MVFSFVQLIRCLLSRKLLTTPKYMQSHSYVKSTSSVFDVRPGVATESPKWDGLSEAGLVVNSPAPIAGALICAHRGAAKSSKSINSAPFPIFQFVLAVPKGFYTFATHFINKLILNHEQLRDSIHSQSRFV